MTMHPPPKREHPTPDEPKSSDKKSADERSQESVTPKDGLTEELHEVPADDSPHLPPTPEGPEKHPFHGTYDF